MSCDRKIEKNNCNNLLIKDPYMQSRAPLKMPYHGIKIYRMDSFDQEKKGYIGWIVTHPPESDVLS